MTQTNFIEWAELTTKRDRGEEKLRCPKCDDQRSDKNDKSLRINHDKGVGFCHYCGAKTVRKDDSFKANLINKDYKIPEQDWQNYTLLSDNLVRWIAKERRIRQETLIELGVTEELQYQPSIGKEVNNIVFNYFEGGLVVNKKYRSGNKKFTQTKDGKPILYNINSAIGADELWIVEGEFDVLALHEVGVKSVVSLPNGANDNDDYWINSERYLKDVKRFVIATDNDEKGLAIRDRIAQRLGRYRCEYVDWQNKDANDDLVSGVLDVSVKNRKRFPVGGTFKVSDIYSSLMGLYENGFPKTLCPKKTCFGNLHKVFSTMRGHLLVTTGIPSHGKSTFIEWFVLNLIDEERMKASFFSPEHRPMELHISNFAQLAVGKPFFGANRMKPSDIERFKNWADEKIYFTSPEGSDAATWDWLLSTFKEQMYAYGVDIFVIDAFNKVLLPSGANKKDAIDDVLTKVTAFAQANSVLVVLVAHPTKMQKKQDGTYEKPTLYDVSGSADFRNQTHDGLGVYRYFETEMCEGYNEVINLKTKYKFQGDIGQHIDFEYDTQTGRFFAKGFAKFYDDLTLDAADQQTEMDIFDINPEDAF